MMFRARTLSRLMKVGGCERRMAVTQESWHAAAGCVSSSLSCVFPDMIYEDVQRESVPQGADNGWSSSEFESYDEQSDNETKLPTRSKVAPACSGLMCVCPRWIIRSLEFKWHHEQPGFPLFSFQHKIIKENITSPAPPAHLSLLMY